MSAAPPLQVVVLSALPNKAGSGWFGNIVFVGVTSLWILGLQGHLSQAWSAGQWWNVIWMSGLMVAIVALGWKAKVGLFNYAYLGAANWARWRATRARGRDVPIEEWTHAWMSLLGCGVMALMPLAKVRRQDVERKYGVRLPDVVIEPGLQAVAEEMNGALGREESWTAHRISRTWEVAAIVAAMFMAPIACGVIGGSITASAPTKSTIDTVMLCLSTGLFLGIPLAGGAYITRKIGVVTIEHRQDGTHLVLTKGSRIHRLAAHDVLIACVHHYRQPSGVLSRTPSGLNAIITPTAATPAMRVALGDPRAFIAALTPDGPAAAKQDGPAPAVTLTTPTTLPSHDRPQSPA